MTALQVGTCDIIAIADSRSLRASCRVTVKLVPVESIAFEQESYEVGMDEEIGLRVSFTPTYASNKQINWSSSNEQVFTVDAKGKVRGVSAGVATLTALSADRNHSATCEVKVLGPDRYMMASVVGSSIVSLNGYITGFVDGRIKNTGSQPVKLISLQVIDGLDGRVVGEVTDASLPGILLPGESNTLSFNLRYVYQPIFLWHFEYDGLPYDVAAVYSDPRPSW